MVAGFYFDPWHGGCLRRIVKVGERDYKIHGVYGNDDTVRRPRHVEYHSESSKMTHKYWYATLRVHETKNNVLHLKVHFGGKPDKPRVEYDATYDPRLRIIQWDDTNVWQQVYYNPRQLV